MMKSTYWLFVLTVVAGCATTPASETKSDPLETARIPRLVAKDDKWFITGLSLDFSASIEDGLLFTVLQPIPNTPDSRPIAVLRTLGPASGSTVGVGVQCLAPDTELVADMPVEALRSSTDRRVGPCLARVVDTGHTRTGAPYVTLNVGSGLGVEPGTQYQLLGRSIAAPGYRPLGLGTDQDGLCQVPASPDHLSPNTARCEIIELPRDRTLGELRSSFAALYDD